MAPELASGNAKKHDLIVQNKTAPAAPPASETLRVRVKPSARSSVVVRRARSPRLRFLDLPNEVRQPEDCRRGNRMEKDCFMASPQRTWMILLRRDKFTTFELSCPDLG